jgi:hypothetical protein
MPEHMASCASALPVGVWGRAKPARVTATAWLVLDGAVCCRRRPSLGLLMFATILR